MMLYVFHVEVGRMLSFDMTVALSSVENLKETIHRLHGIPAETIVLLVSGGEMLTQATQVSYYSAGTDSNPIYMFVTTVPESDEKIAAAAALPSSYAIDLDLRRLVEESLSLPAELDTVRRRAALAARMYDLAREEERQCERLVHDQHLQQQGWSAVVANLDDLISEFLVRNESFFAAFDVHLQKSPACFKLLSCFEEDMEKLARIPILPSLRKYAELDFHGFDDLLENENVFTQSEIPQESEGEVEDDATTAAEETPVSTETATTETEATTKGDDVVADIETAGGNEKSTSSTTPTKKPKMAEDVEESLTALATAAANADAQERGSQTSTSSSSRRFSLNLLQWITSKENHDALKLMAAECMQGLATFNQDAYTKVKTDIINVLNFPKLHDVKEIKGLGDRLCKLEEAKFKIKKMVQDQKELSTAFQQNQARAINLADPSILPDLCDSHQSQLQVMLTNHRKIREDCRCVAKAKIELGQNMRVRLKHIVITEHAMNEIDNNLLFYHHCLRRAERHINIIEQIHRAPSIYMAAVTEVVRRKIFSSEFSLWASKLSKDFDAIHKEELSRRQEFNDSFEGHFLNLLFPGMNDMPPTFANDSPFIFDARLPNLTKSDMDVLLTHLPDFASQIQLPDMGPVIHFFVSRSGEHQSDCIDELLKQHVNAALMQPAAEKPLQHQRLSELQKDVASGGGDGAVGSGIGVGGSGTSGCDESETDTETEFEKVAVTTCGTSMPNLTTNVATSTTENASESSETQTTTVETIERSTTTEPKLMVSTETLTDENSESVPAEVARLRELMRVMSIKSMECLEMARVNISDFRNNSLDDIDDVSTQLHTVCDNLAVMRIQCDEITREKQAKVEELTGLLTSCNAELEAERNEIKSLNIKCMTLEAQLDELLEKEKNMEAEKEAAIAEAREKLINDRRIEIEMMRSHFERSSSDLSLEKLERPQSSTEQMVIDLVQHEQLLAQQRAEFETQKERAINEALEKERAIWQMKIFPMNSESVMANVNILKDMIEDKERQLDLLREQDKHLNQENFELKTRINALTNEEGNSWLKEKIEYLSRDKSRLEEELNVEKSKRAEMETSVATAKATTSEHSGKQKYITLDSCAKDDLVFVVWNTRHWQYVVVQDSSSLYFLHNDSIAELNFKVPERYEHDDDWTQAAWPLYFIGRVKDKEYCMARKSENRYHVERGTKFYRVKLTPVMLRITRRDDELPSFSGALGVSVAVTGSGANAGASANANASTSTGAGAAANAAASATATATTPATVTTPANIPATTTTDASTTTTTTAASTTPATMSASLSVPMTTSILTASTAILTSTSAAITDTTSIPTPPPPPPSSSTTNTTQQMQIQKIEESVITEQPTAAYAQKMLADLLMEIELEKKEEEIANMVCDNVDDENDDDNDNGDDSDDNDDNDYENDDDNDVDNDNDDDDNVDNEEQEQKNQNVVETTDQTTTLSTATNTTSNVTPSTTETEPQQQQENPTVDPVPYITFSIPISMQFDDESNDFRSCLSTTPSTTAAATLPPPSLALPLSAVTTISEDSDEYRSLEAKDENDYSIFE